MQKQCFLAALGDSQLELLELDGLVQLGGFLLEEDQRLRPLHQQLVVVRFENPQLAAVGLQLPSAYEVQAPVDGDHSDLLHVLEVASRQHLDRGGLFLHYEVVVDDHDVVRLAQGGVRRDVVGHLRRKLFAGQLSALEAEHSSHAHGLLFDFESLVLRDLQEGLLFLFLQGLLLLKSLDANPLLDVVDELLDVHFHQDELAEVQCCISLARLGQSSSFLVEAVDHCLLVV